MGSPKPPAAASTAELLARLQRHYIKPGQQLPGGVFLPEVGRNGGWGEGGAQSATNQPSGRVSAFAPPFEWVSRIVAQACEAGCRIHLKPNLLGAVGPKSPGMQLPDEYPDLEEVS
jgi:hypothetical protein